MARAVAHSEAADRTAGTSVRAERKPRTKDSRACPLRPTGALARVLPIDGVGLSAFPAFGVLPAFGNDGAGMTRGADDVGFPNDAPVLGPVAADLEVSLRDPNLHVVHVEDHIVLGRILDHTIPCAAPEFLPLRASAAAACPSDVSHASLVRVPEWRPAGRPGTSCLRT